MIFLRKNSLRRARFEKRDMTIRIVMSLGIILANSSLFGQAGGSGVEDLFRIGTDSRTMALGNAAAAFPQDPSGFLWNPAGTVVVQQKSILFSHTTLFDDVQYQSINYAPTPSAAHSAWACRARIGRITGMRIGRRNGSGIPIDMVKSPTGGES
jgi:hypothetical protein